MDPYNLRSHDTLPTRPVQDLHTTEGISQSDVAGRPAGPAPAEPYAHPLTPERVGLGISSSVAGPEIESGELTLRSDTPARSTEITRSDISETPSPPVLTPQRSEPMPIQPIGRLPHSLADTKLTSGFETELDVAKYKIIKKETEIATISDAETISEFKPTSHIPHQIHGSHAGNVSGATSKSRIPSHKPRM